jgi:hypothetical protein
VSPTASRRSPPLCGLATIRFGAQLNYGIRSGRFVLHTLHQLHDTAFGRDRDANGGRSIITDSATKVVDIAAYRDKGRMLAQTPAGHGKSQGVRRLSP